MEREFVFRCDQIEAAKLVTRSTVLHTKNLVLLFLRVLCASAVRIVFSVFYLLLLQEIRNE
jgi:hypothetical protein